MSNQKSRRTFIRSAVVAGLAPKLMLPGNKPSEAENIGASSEKNLVFLFQGDSITDGNRGRTADPNHIMGHGYAFAVASRIGADFPQEGFSFYNRGISGNKIPDLQKRWQADTLDLKPDVLSLLVGINDAAASVNKSADALGAEDFETGYRQLLQQSKAAQTGVLFVLGIPFVYPVGKRNDDWVSWKEQTSLRAEKVRKLAREFDAVVVDYPAMFDKAMKKAPASYWVWDGVHPTIFGHELMAREWIKQVQGRLKFLRKYK